MTVRQVPTRFRAYQLGQAGASYSLLADGNFTLIEARLTDLSRHNIDAELAVARRSRIDCLHITGWDHDHCAVADLNEILDRYSPTTIEYPGYSPHTDTARECLACIQAYQRRQERIGDRVQCLAINPEYVKSLKTAESLAYRDVLYHPRHLYEGDSNNNSTVKLFRRGSFNVASLGDVEHENLSSYLRRCSMFHREVDVLVLAHHGADCPTNSKTFLEKVNPSLAICCSQFDNQFEHPKEEVQLRLFELGIPVMTTKTGDVIIESLQPHTGRFRATNLKANSTAISSQKDFTARKSRLLGMNQDSIRNLYRPGFTGLKPR